MNGDARTRLRLLLATAAGLATAWAGIVAVQGRFVVQVGSLRLLSSRSPQGPLVLAAVAAFGAWRLSTPAERRRLRSAMWTAIEHGLVALHRVLLGPILKAAEQVPSWCAPAMAGAAAVAVVVVALTKGALVAGGADAYGYVSQAHLWAHGTLQIEQPFVRDMDWPFAADSFSPLGYRPAVRGTAIVPTYSAGLPMVMAVFETVAGPDAVFWVVPLLGGFAVWMTYLMGTRLAGRGVGAAAALLLASSPTFLIQLMVPMSDVPVAGWWAAALGLLLVEGHWAALAAGLATGAAILTRPNLVPLAAIPGALLCWRVLEERTLTGGAAKRVLLFAAGAVPSCVAVAIINTRLYGSPLASGYPPFNELFGLQNLIPNLARYPRWMMETETPFVLLGLAAPFAITRMRGPAGPDGYRQPIVRMWLGFVAAVFLCYIFYVPFDGWFWLRFVLPAFPPLFVLFSIGLSALVARLARGARVTAMVAVVGALAWHGAAFAGAQGVFDTRPGEHKYVAIGDYISQHLPDRAVFLSMQYSGSIRYYSGRLTVRYNALLPHRLDSVIEQLRARGYHPYILLEDWEEPEFQAQFKGHSPLSALDWPPVAELDHLAHVRIWDPADRETPARERRATEIIR